MLRIQGELMRHEPFHNLVILDVLRATVLNGPTSMAAKYSEHFVSVLDDHEDEAELPSGLVAFVAMTVSVSYAILIYTLMLFQVYSILADWRNRSGLHDPEKVSYIPEHHYQVYGKYQGLLRFIYMTGDEGPKRSHMLLLQMYQHVM